MMAKVNKQSLLVLVLITAAFMACGSPTSPETPNPPAPQPYEDKPGTGSVLNGDFETGTFSGWTQGSFLNSGSLNRTAGGTLVSKVLGPFDKESQSDPKTDGVVKYPLYGKYTAIVGSTMTGYNSNTLSQTFTVKTDDVSTQDSKVHLKFRWAYVLQDPGHTPADNPYGLITVKNISKSNDVLFSFLVNTSTSGLAWKVSTSSAGFKYLEWQTTEVIGTAAHPINVGDSIFVEFVAAGCAAGGHAGYGYLEQITTKDFPKMVYP